MTPSDIPTAVYRLQLNAQFTLKQAISILPYLKELGVEAIYCSPYYDSYNSHGYDVTNPNSLNPAVGTPKDFDHFCAELKKLDLKHILDVVPNHMGIQGGKNQWWQDVLENGPYSDYADFFDIDWNPDKHELKNRVLFPILGAPYGQVLEDQEIQLDFEEGIFFLRYGDAILPLCPESYPKILGPETPKIYQTFPLQTDERSQAKKEGQKVLKQIVKKIPKLTTDQLDALIEAQFYRLSYWKVASHEINYRRFFNIHELAAICIENPKVLEAHHKWIFELVEEGKVQGLRIDHPDGLYDPLGYFKRLRERFSIYTVVEKILDRKEKLSSLWQVEGTVGYEYLNVLNGIFICQENEKAFTEIYEEFVRGHVDFEQTLYESKKLFTNYEMVSEVDALGLRLDRLSEHDRLYRDFTRLDLTKALAEVIANFPVYRTYIAPEGEVSSRDAHYITIAIEKAKALATDLDPSIFEFLEKVLLQQLPDNAQQYRDFVLRFQQLTGPLMAKGLEDTAFYRYNRFISLNEVGGDPEHFGYSLEDYHRHNQEKVKEWPYGFLATSTHDTKRSEDVRMRLNVLSEMPERWQLEVKKWAIVNQKFPKPSPEIEYFIYQTLLGAWPLSFERLWEVILKSMREAKQETSWNQPNDEYEMRVSQFVRNILDPKHHFLHLFLEFYEEVAHYGNLNSLSQTAIKLASCGVVDTFQGNELLHYRLVDPDNRTPVDFNPRKKLLQQASIKKEPKLFLHYKGLNFRKQHPELFLIGEYQPLPVKSEHLIAFYRRHKNQTLVVLAGRFYASNPNWEEIELPFEKGYEVFTGKTVSKRVQMDQTFPVSWVYHKS